MKNILSDVSDVSAIDFDTFAYDISTRDVPCDNLRCDTSYLRSKWVQTYFSCLLHSALNSFIQKLDVSNELLEMKLIYVNVGYVSFPNIFWFVTKQLKTLNQWFPTGAPRHTMVPWRGVRGAAKYWIYYLFSSFTTKGAPNCHFIQVRVPTNFFQSYKVPWAKKGWKTLRKTFRGR